jgi:hypothetical protein
MGRGRTKAKGEEAAMQHHARQHTPAVAGGRRPATGARGHGAHAAEAGGGAPAQAAGGDASAEAAVGLTVPLHFVWAGHVGPVRAL